MNETQLIKISKYLSKHLRHQPERLGLTLDAAGWVEVEQLLAACAAHRFRITREQLEEVVARNNKQRFAFNASGTKIRANQGHSVAVDLQLQPQTPPSTLYHGTGHKSAAAIAEQGLQKMRRHHVHLSCDLETATTVGARHGKPVVFEVDTTAMHTAGYQFFVSANGVWLVDAVPPQYLRKITA